MRALLPLLLVALLFASAEAAPPRLTVKDLSLIAREVQQHPGANGFGPIGAVNPSGPIQTASPPATYAVPAASWEFRNEQHWVIDSIVRDIAEIIAIAHSGRSTPARPTVSISENAPGTFDVQVEHGGVRMEKRFELKGHLWWAETYTPVAAALLEAWAGGTKRDTSPRDAALLTALATGETAHIIRQSKRISAQLTQRPLDATLHENAALVVASLALRESAGLFSDSRVLLSRTAAHLALARALQPREGEAAPIARAIVSALVGRQQEAVNSLPSFSASAAAWKTALQLRTTGDWRIVTAPAKASGLEQKELFRAMRDAGAAAKSIELLRKLRAPMSADWSRAAMEYPMSVQHGHAFRLNSLPLEIASLVSDYEAFHGGTPGQPELITLLNRTPERAVVQPINGESQIEVLSWGHLAAFHQRHICQSLVQTTLFLRDTLAIKNEAAEFEREAEKQFSGLTLFPFAKVKAAKDGRSSPQNAAAAALLANTQPQLVTASAWRSGAPGTMALRWFSPELPFGTLYDLSGRINHLAPHLVEQLGAAFWAGPAREMAPWDWFVYRFAKSQKFGATPTSAQLAELAGSTRDYDTHVMRDLAKAAKDQPQVYREVMERHCAIEPDGYLELGEHLVAHASPAEAAAAYQLAFDKATDRVAVANGIRWVVEYYLREGRRAEAEKIARDAGESGSARGLSTMALMLEKTDRHAEAEQVYKKMAERYDDRSDLTAFYLRHRERSPEFARAAAAHLAALFPKGQEQVQLGDFSERPADGAMITSFTPLVRQVGLKSGDIIVSLDGVRVRSVDQYLFLREQAPDAPMTLIVWDGAQHRELRVAVPQRRLHCSLETVGTRR